MENHKEYEGFAYSGWQEGLDRQNPDSGFHLYTCTRCGTTITERNMPAHRIQMCNSILKAIGENSLETALKD